MEHEHVPRELREDWRVAADTYLVTLREFREYPDMVPRAERRLYLAERRIVEWRSGRTYQGRWKWKGKHLAGVAERSIGIS